LTKHSDECKFHGVATADPTFLDDYLPYLLRRADQTLSAPFYGVLADRGVARSEWRVLAVLLEVREMRVAELAAAALSPQPTVTNALRRLERRGLVRRTPGTDDRRQRIVSLTPAGSRLTADLVDVAARLEADALADAGDLTELVRRLRDLTARVDARITRRDRPVVSAGTDQS